MFFLEDTLISYLVLMQLLMGPLAVVFLTRTFQYMLRFFIKKTCGCERCFEMPKIDGKQDV